MFYSIEREERMFIQWEIFEITHLDFIYDSGQSQYRNSISQIPLIYEKDHCAREANSLLNQIFPDKNTETH